MCKHEWKWNYDCFEDAREIDDDFLGIPIKCKLCGAECIEWYKFSDVEIRQHERTWDCYTLSELDIQEVAEQKGLSLEGVDLRCSTDQQGLDNRGRDTAGKEKRK